MTIEDMKRTLLYMFVCSLTAMCVRVVARKGCVNSRTPAQESVAELRYGVDVEGMSPHQRLLSGETTGAILRRFGRTARDIIGWMSPRKVFSH